MSYLKLNYLSFLFYKTKIHIFALIKKCLTLKKKTMVYIVAILLLVINFLLFNVTGLIITFFVFAYVSFARHYVLYNIIPFFKELSIEKQNYILANFNFISDLMGKYNYYLGIDDYKNYKYYKLSVYIKSALTFIPLYITKTLLIKFFEKH